MRPFTPGRWRTLAFLIVLFTTHAQAAVQAWVDRDRIEANEQIRLTIQAEGSRRGAAPDLSSLQQDFRFVQPPARRSQVSIINGRTTMSETWQVMLEPLRTGTLKIPAFDVHGERTAAIEVVVTPVDPARQRQFRQLAFFDNQVSAERVPVQGELIYVMRLLYADGVQLFSGLPEPPVIEHAIVQALTDPQPGAELRGGVRYSTIEQRFAIYPQRSGEIVLPGTEVRGAARIRGRRQRIPIESEPIRVEVTRPPQSWGSDPWLPARELEIVEGFSREPAALNVGEVVTRTVIVRARGQLASMLPRELKLAPDNLRNYVQPPGDREVPDPRGVVSTRTFVVDLSPERPEEATFPELQIPWFNVQTGKREVAVLPARTLPVQGVAVADCPPPTVAAAPPPIVEDAGEAPTPQADQTVRNGLWFWISMLLGAGWAGTVVWGRLQRRRADKPASRNTSNDNRVSAREAIARLRKAASSNDPESVRVALANWAGQRYGCSPSRGMTQLQRDHGDAPELQRLNAALFGGSNPDWTATGLVEWVASLPPLSDPSAKAAAGQSDLPPLYPRYS